MTIFSVQAYWESYTSSSFDFKLTRIVYSSQSIPYFPLSALSAFVLHLKTLTIFQLRIFTKNGDRPSRCDCFLVMYATLKRPSVEREGPGKDTNYQSLLGNFQYGERSWRSIRQCKHATFIRNPLSNEGLNVTSICKSWIMFVRLTTL